MSTQFHTIGRSLVLLEIGTPLRALDQGMSKPILFELEGPDGPAHWVVKPRSLDRRGGDGLVCEVAAADIAVALGLRVPAMGMLEFPSVPLEVETSELGHRVAEVYRRDAGGTAFCSRFIEGGVHAVRGMFDDLRSVPLEMQEDAVRLFALDVLLRHYDRRPGNPNLLVHEDRLVVIDHGHAFHGIEQVTEEGLSKFADTDQDQAALADHVCASVAARDRYEHVFDDVLARVRALDDTTLDRLASAWPDALDRSPDGTPSGMRSSVVAALRARRDAFPSLLRSVRAAL